MTQRLKCVLVVNFVLWALTVVFWDQSLLAGRQTAALYGCAFSGGTTDVCIEEMRQVE